MPLCITAERSDKQPRLYVGTIAERKDARSCRGVCTNQLYTCAGRRGAPVSGPEDTRLTLNTNLVFLNLSVPLT